MVVGFVNAAPVLGRGGYHDAADTRESCNLRTPYTVPVAPHRSARMTLDAGSKPISTSPPNASLIAERKAALYKAVENLDLGREILDDKNAQEEVDKHIVALEELNPTENPADHSLRRARWRIVYTTSPIVLGRNRPGFAKPEFGWQTLDMVDGEDEGNVKNEEESGFSVLGMNFRFRNQIVGRCKALKGTRIRLKFEKFTLGNLISVPFPGPVVGWQDQTFLDEELRVARSHFGNVFVLKRDD